MIFRVAVLFLTIASSCFAGTISPSAKDKDHLSYGQEHECVVKIYGDCTCELAGGKSHKFIASAVVISPRWIVTAAHVAKEAKNVKVMVRDKEYEIPRLVISEGFDLDKVGMNDIALGQSDVDMELDFYPDLYESDDEVGKIASICGFGTTGTFRTGATKTDGQKRAGSNVIDRAENHVLVCSVSNGPRTTLEFMISHGDSGGGLFIENKLAGINSFVSAVDGKPDSGYGDECNHTRVSLFVGWIKQNIREDKE